MATTTMHPGTGHRGRRLLAACLTLLAATAALGSETTTIEGTVVDADGRPVADGRVVARVADGTSVFVSGPSDAAGRYVVVVPSGQRYMLIALISPTGLRIVLPQAEALSATGGTLSRDLQVQLPSAPRPRAGMRAVGGADRLFLSFVEDPALADGRYVELQANTARDDAGADLDAVRVIAAFSFADLPRVEVGLRAGYGDIRSGGAADGSGAQDLELWGKVRLLGSTDDRWNLALGALITTPTGDEDAGLSADSTRAEWFVTASRTFARTVAIGHVGIAANEGGDLAGRPLDGEIAASAGLGVLLPLSGKLSAAFEATYDGARFEQTDSESRILAGVSWQAHMRGKLRAALAAGVADASPDAELIVGYALSF